MCNVINQREYIVSKILFHNKFSILPCACVFAIRITSFLWGMRYEVRGSFISIERTHNIRS